MLQIVSIASQISRLSDNSIDYRSTTAAEEDKWKLLRVNRRIEWVSTENTYRKCSIITSNLITFTQNRNGCERAEEKERATIMCNSMAFNNNSILTFAISIRFLAEHDVSTKAQKQSAVGQRRTHNQIPPRRKTFSSFFFNLSTRLSLIV